jgi:hypothetical protein
VINARTISYALLACSLVTLLYAVFIGAAVASWLVFLLGAGIVVSFGIQILRVRREQRQFALSQYLPPHVQTAVVIAGAAGGILFLVNMLGAMPPKTPSGVAVSAFSAEAIAGVCRLTYNGVETVVRPISECQSFEKKGSLIVSGAFVLFSAVGVWLAHLATGFEARHVSKS